MTGSKGGVPAKKREIQQATISQNEQLVKQLDERLKELHKFQDEPESLQTAIDELIGHKAVAKDAITDMKARIKADEDREIEERAAAMKKASPAEDPLPYIDKE